MNDLTNTSAAETTPLCPGQLALLTHRGPIGSARATASDGTVTTYLVHAADDRHLHVTRSDADAGPWNILHAPPAPVRREEFSQISLHTADHPSTATERPTPSCR